MKILSFENMKYKDNDYPLSRLHLCKDIRLKRKLSDIRKDEKISLLSDIMFKTMFMDSRRIKYPAKFLSIAFNVEFQEVLENINPLPTILDKNAVKNKGFEGDFVAELYGYLISIESNNTDKTDRNMNYLDILENRKLLVGSKYKYPKGAFQIMINNFSKGGHEKAIEIYGLKNGNENLLTFRKQYMIIYVPNLLKKLYNREELSELERFVLVVVLTDVKLAKELAGKDEIMQEYIEESKRVEQNDEYLLRAYDHIEDEKEYEYLVGKDDGLEEGLEQGIEQGEMNKESEIIQKMYAKGHSIEDISYALELDISRVREIVNC